MINLELKNEVFELFDEVLGIEHSLLEHLTRDSNSLRLKQLKKILEKVKEILEGEYQLGLACISVKDECGFDLYEMFESEVLNEEDIYSLTKVIKDRLIRLYRR